MAFTRRRFVQAAALGASALGLSRPRPGAKRTDPRRPDDGQDRSARVRRHRHGARPGPVPERAQQHAWPAARWSCSSPTSAACRRSRAPRRRSWSSATRSTS